MEMNVTANRNPQPHSGELKSQISHLEDHYVDIFLGGSHKEMLKKIHLQLTVLKAELMLCEEKLDKAS